MDTDQQSMYGEEESISLLGWLEVSSSSIEYDWSGNVEIAFALLKNAGEGEALALLRSLPSQLVSGVYLK